MADSFSKKENSKKKIKKKQEKTLRREERKSNNNKGKDFDDMIVYIDVNGNFTSVPPHLQDKAEDLAHKRNTEKASGIDPDTVYSGTVSYVSEKGYGFIAEEKTGESIFFHQGQLSQIIDKHDKVSYKKELSPKGYRAIDIKK